VAVTLPPGIVSGNRTSSETGVEAIDAAAGAGAPFAEDLSATVAATFALPSSANAAEATVGTSPDALAARGDGT